LLRTHASVPSGSPLLQPTPRSRSLCRLLPVPAAGGPSRRYLCESFLGCLGPYPGGTWSAFACFFLHDIGLPPFTIEVCFPASSRQNDFLTDRNFGTAAIPLCSGPQVCSPPRSFPPLRSIVAEQPRLLHPSRACFVSSTCIGHANHPFPGN